MQDDNIDKMTKWDGMQWQIWFKGSKQSVIVVIPRWQAQPARDWWVKQTGTFPTSVSRV
tara:strand:+ start:269 stop:445 length:177 start_codon:yes stop_codon:yes gene_type:complete